MKQLLRACGLILGLSTIALCAPSGPPAGNYITNISTNATQQIFNVSSGTVSGQLTVGSCQLSGGGSCGSGGGGSSSLAVLVNSVQISSPTSSVGFVGTGVSSSNSGSSTTVILNNIANQSTVQKNSTFFVTSGTVQGPFTILSPTAGAVNPSTATLTTNLTNTNYGTDTMSLIDNSSLGGFVISLSSTAGGQSSQIKMEPPTVSYAGINGSAVVVNNGIAFSSTTIVFPAGVSNQVGLKGPASASTNPVWTLPSADGTSGQVLQTNGAGSLSFTNGGSSGGASVYPATATASFPYGLSASTITSAISDKGGQVFNVKAYGAVGDAQQFNDGVANGTTLFTSAKANFTGSAGKTIEIIGVGPGGSTFSGCSGAMSGSLLSCSGGSFASTDFGRSIYIAATGQWTHVFTVISSTQVQLASWVGTTQTSTLFTSTFSATSVYMGYMTYVSTIASVTNANTITLSSATWASGTSLTYVFGTPDQAAFQSAMDAAGQVGGGTVLAPGIYASACSSSATACGYLWTVTDQTTASLAASVMIRYNNVSLIGDQSKTNIFGYGAYSIYSGNVIRGSAISIGDDGGSYISPAGSTRSPINVKIANLNINGMTDGLTYQYDFGSTIGHTLYAYGDGWDTTHKGIALIPGAAVSGIRIDNCTIANFKGEEIYVGGNLLYDIQTTNSILTNSNASLLSVSAGVQYVTGNTFSLCGSNCIENTVDYTIGSQDMSVIQSISNNVFKVVPTQAITIAGAYNSPPNGSPFIIDNNLFLVNGQGQGRSSATTAIYSQPQAGGNYPVSNLSVTRNTFDDVNQAINAAGGTSINWFIDSNKFIVDQYPVTQFFGMTSPINGMTISNNIGIQTSSAIASGYYPRRIYNISQFYFGAGSLSFQNVIIKNNNWGFNSGTSIYEWDTTPPGLTVLSNKNINWQNEYCPYCANSALTNYGAVTISTGGVIPPYGPVVWLTGGTQTSSMTIDASKEEDGSEIEIRNVGSYGVIFSPDSYINIPSSFTLSASNIAKFKYSAGNSKWNLMNSAFSGGSGGSGSGTITGVTAGTGLSGGGTSGTVTVNLTTPVSVANGGTGTASPGLVAGTNVTISGSWPNQTINSSGVGAGVSSFNSRTGAVVLLSSDVPVGASGGLDCTTGGVCDIVTAVVPRLAQANSWTGSNNFANAAATYPMVSTNTLPGTCSVGQQAYLNTASAGQNLYACTATNTWTQEGGAGGATVVSSSPYIQIGGINYIPSDAMYQATPSQLSGWTKMMTTPSNLGLINRSVGDVIMVASNSVNYTYIMQNASTTTIEISYRAGSNISNYTMVGVFAVDTTNGLVRICGEQMSPTTPGFANVYNASYNGASVDPAAVSVAYTNLSESTQGHLKLSMNGSTLSCSNSVNGTVYDTETGVGTISYLGIVTSNVSAEIYSVKVQ